MKTVYLQEELHVLLHDRDWESTKPSLSGVLVPQQPGSLKALIKY